MLENVFTSALVAPVVMAIFFGVFFALLFPVVEGWIGGSGDRSTRRRIAIGLMSGGGFGALTLARDGLGAPAIVWAAVLLSVIAVAGLVLLLAAHRARVGGRVN